MLQLRARVVLGVIAIKGCSAFPKVPALMDTHHEIVLCHIQDTRWEGLIPLQSSSRCNQQPQPTGRFHVRVSHFSAGENSTFHIGKVLQGNLHYILNNLLDCNIVSSSELQLHYDINFHTNALGKGMNPISPSYGLNITATIFLPE